MAAKKKSASVEAGEAYHELATYVPVAKEVIELERELFRAADDLGIGVEVRELYFGATWGSVVGTSVANLATSAALAQGGAYATLATWASTAGLTVGIVAGVAVALVSLFGGDDDSEEKIRAYDAAMAKLLASQTARLSIDELAREQRRAWELGQGPVAKLMGAEAQHACEVAGRVADLYERMGRELSPSALALFVSTTNVGRWTRFRNGWAGRAARLRADSATLPAGPVGASAKKAAEYLAAYADKMVAALDSVIDKELAHFRKMTDLLGQAMGTRPRTKIPIRLPSRKGGWLLAAGAAALLLWRRLT